MRNVAVYLPQFHRIPENDEWWGEGFTDWVSTKLGVPQYEGHYQPHIPLNNNYYDLLNPNVLHWQASIMKEYGIDGLCFFHYWFKDGKTVLEKPAEILLGDKSINIPFCFCWANMTWARSWAKLRDVDCWINEDDKKIRYGEKTILLEQSYGFEEHWKEHFEYLLPFFKDDRYIKVEDKPVIWIYRMDTMPCFDEMMEYWTKLALKNGLKGIYVIGQLCNRYDYKYLDAEIMGEPTITLTQAPYKNINDSDTKVYDYDEFCKRSLAKKGKIKTYYTSLVNYDDTPRQGNKGHVISSTPLLFEKYLSLVMKKNEICGNDITFINAWNEWGEGNHLEPDEKHGYAYLEAVKNAKRRYKETDIFEYFSFKKADENVDYEGLKKKYDNVCANLKILDLWMSMQLEGIDIKSYFLQQNISSIAIYGYGVLGRLLYKGLMNSCIEIRFIIDNSKMVQAENDLIGSIEEYKRNAEAIIVTPMGYANEIIFDLEKRGINNYITLDEVVKNLFAWNEKK